MPRANRVSVLLLAALAACLAAWAAGPPPPAGRTAGPPPPTGPAPAGRTAAPRPPAGPAPATSTAPAGTAAPADARAQGADRPPAGDPEYHNLAYGYRLRYPQGWQAMDLMGALGRGLEQSPDVLLYPSEALRWENIGMGVRICQATGARRTDCLPAHSQLLARTQTRVAGRAADQFDLQRRPPREETWLERHVLVAHGPHTVQIWASWPPRDPWQQRIPALYQRMLESFAFTRPAGGGKWAPARRNG